jgi:hypothetical protein
MLITEDYRAQQTKLHEDPAYGRASVAHAPLVAKAINAFNVGEVLDYGAGKLALLKTISTKLLVDHKFRYIPYEPADLRYSDKPEPAQMVVCLDVLEHIEPELIDNVLDDLKRLVLEVGLFTIHCTQAKKVLPDGRNAHLIQEGMAWWLPKIMERFDVQTVQKTKGSVPGSYGFWVMVSPL